jgi:hypothetical protein
MNEANEAARKIKAAHKIMGDDCIVTPEFIDSALAIEAASGVKLDSVCFDARKRRVPGLVVAVGEGWQVRRYLGDGNALCLL